MNMSFSSRDPMNNTNVTCLLEQNGLYACRDEIVPRIMIHFIMYPIAILTGIIGNVLTLKVFAGKEKNSRNLFIMSLATSDLCLLGTNALAVMNVLMRTLNTEILLPSYLLFQLLRCPDRIGKLLTAAMTVERLTAVYFPLRFKQIWTRGKARKCITDLVLKVFLTNIPMFIDSLYKYITKNTNQLPSGGNLLEQRADWLSVLYASNMVIFDWVPIVTIFVLSIVTVFGVRKMLSSKLLKFSTSEMVERKRREKKITIILMSISLTLCLLNFPGFAVSILFQFSLVDNIPTIVGSLNRFLMVLNSVINFFIFGASDKDLREEYKQHLRCCREESSPP